MAPMTNLSKGTRLKNWILGDKLGAGACSDVYAVTSSTPLDKVAAQKQFVIKLSPLSVPNKANNKNNNKKRKKTTEERNADALYAEHLLYQHLLRGQRGVPIIPTGAYGEDQGYRFLVIERLGRTLEQVRQEVGQIPVQTAAQLGLELLDLFKSLHTKGLIYVDVKPENFMLGLGHETQVYCVDFGLAERVRLATGKHKPFKQGAIVGTPTFLSLNCHRGATASRRDDIEALLHVLLYLIRGNLPWQQAKSDAEGATIKENTSLDTLCKGFPKQWKLMLEKIRSCGFEDKPDYEFFTNQFESLGATANRDSNQPFDWGKSSKVTKPGVHTKATPSDDTCASPPPKRTKSTPKAASTKQPQAKKSTSPTTPATKTPVRRDQGKKKKVGQQHNEQQQEQQDEAAAAAGEKGLGNDNDATPNHMANEVEYVMTLQPDPRRRRKAATTAVAAAAAAKAFALKAHNATGRYSLRRRSTENTN